MPDDGPAPPLTVTADEFTADPARLLRLAREGHEVLVTDDGATVARMVPPEPPRPLGLLKGRIHVPDPWPKLPDDIIDIMEGSEDDPALW